MSQYAERTRTTFPYEVTEHKVEQIIQWAHLGDYIEEKVSNLSEKIIYAQLLLSIASSKTILSF